MKDQKVIFFENPHTYWFSERKLNSVGSIIGKFFPDFEGEYWLNHGVLKEYFADEYVEHYRSFGNYMPEPNDLFSAFINKMGASLFISEKQKKEDAWELKRTISTYRGTKFHTEAEKRAYEQGYLVNPWDKMMYHVEQRVKEFDNESITMNLAELEDGAYPELLIYHLGLGVAGQADEVYIQTIGDKRYVDIGDHKTNEKKPPKSDPSRCFPPFDDFYASKHFKYVVQINMYAYIMSLYGFTVRNMAYYWYKDYDPTTLERIDVKNIQDRLAKVIGN